MSALKKRRVSTGTNTLFNYSNQLKIEPGINVEIPCDKCTYLNKVPTHRTNLKCTICGHTQAISTIPLTNNTVIDLYNDITEFFTPTVNAFDIIKQHTKPNLQPRIIDKILDDDLTYYHNFITAMEQTQLVAELDQHIWHSAIRSVRPRKLQMYGILGDETADISYYRTAGLPAFTTESMPLCTKFLFERLFECGVYKRNDAPVMLIVQEYKYDEGIGAHIDKPFYGDVIADISLIQPCTMRFNECNVPTQYNTYSDYKQYYKYVYSKFGGWSNKSITADGRQLETTLDACSLLVFKNKARWNYLHSIPVLKSGRYGGQGYRRLSITLRTVIDKPTHFDSIRFESADEMAKHIPK